MSSVAKGSNLAERVKVQEMENSKEEVLRSCVLDAAKSYSSAILLLLDNNSVWPAKALLRCLFELTARLSWCLRCPDEADKELRSEMIDKKLCRWDKSAMLQDIRILKDFKRTYPQNAEEIDNQVKKLADEIYDLYVKRMPGYKNLLNEFPNEFEKMVPPQLYSDLHKAVHLDMNVLSKIYMSGKSDLSNDNRDIDELKKLCMFLVKIIEDVTKKDYDLKSFM